jgi:hypothetical protein
MEYFLKIIQSQNLCYFTIMLKFKNFQNINKMDNCMVNTRNFSKVKKFNKKENLRMGQP